MGDQKIRAHVLTILGRRIRSEMKRMCSIKNPSMLRASTPEALTSFDWNKLESELELRAPSLFSLLRSATSVNVPPSKKRKRTYRVQQSQVIGICAAILLRHRNQSMNLLQRILSVLLYNGNASKQVRLSKILITCMLSSHWTFFQLFRRLRQLLLCLSHTRTISFLDKIGRGYDAVVLEWKSNIQKRMAGCQVHNLHSIPLNLQRINTFDFNVG